MKTKFTSKNTWATIVLLLVVSVLVCGCSPEKEAVPTHKTEQHAYRTLKIAQQPSASFNHYDGTIEAIRQTNLAAQVMGEIIELDVAVGDAIKKNQQLVRLDAQAARQAASASHAELASVRAQLRLAKQEYDRQKQLYAKNFISQSALDHAKANYQSVQAQVNAQAAQASVTATQTNFHRIYAPYSGVVSALPVTLGDMAAPGKTLLTIYDASQLRVSAAVPQSVATSMAKASINSAMITMHHDRKITLNSIQILPAADQATHTRIIRINLPKDFSHVAPGMNVKVSFPIENNTADSQKISIPISALVKHAEISGVYVISQSGEPLLRQLRLGETLGDQVEVLSGLSIGEEIAIVPQSVVGTL